MGRYLEVGRDAFVGYARYLWRDITEPSAHSWFYVLLAVSAAALVLERVWPWRRSQFFFREGFWLDAFYLFFNFFGFSLVGFAAVSEVAATAVRDGLASMGVETLALIDAARWPIAAQLIVFFVGRDFIHYWVHRLLHKARPLWRVHQVHHSVRQMGFAAHMRFHPLESAIYRSLEYLPLAALGFDLEHLFYAHAAALVIGHWNHANFRLPLGPLRFVFNSPQMHIWHHARALPEARLRRHGGVNFGLSLSVWDYLFGTAYVPRSGRDEALGFDGIESYPQSFIGQLWAPFRRLQGSTER